MIYSRLPCLEIFIFLSFLAVSFYVIVLLLQPSDPTESAEILKIKQSMQEEAKRFEKEAPPGPPAPPPPQQSSAPPPQNSDSSHADYFGMSQ